MNMLRNLKITTKSVDSIVTSCYSKVFMYRSRCSSSMDETLFHKDEHVSLYILLHPYLYIQIVQCCYKLISPNYNMIRQQIHFLGLIPEFICEEKNCVENIITLFDNYTKFHGIGWCHASDAVKNLKRYEMKINLSTFYGLICWITERYIFSFWVKGQDLYSTNKKQKSLKIKNTQVTRFHCF